MHGRLGFLLITAFLMGATLAADGPSPARDAPTLHLRPFTAKCLSSVNVWVELDSDSLPARLHANPESRKRVLLHLVGSSPSRGESVACSYASRSRDVTSSYFIRCVNPRKERGHRHSYMCM